MIEGIEFVTLRSLVSWQGRVAAPGLCALRQTKRKSCLAAQFLMHGNHNLRPKRSLKIDATNMGIFPMEVAAILKFSAAGSAFFARFLCVGLKSTALINDSGEGKGGN